MLAVSGTDLADRFDIRDIRELVLDDGGDAALVDVTLNAKIIVALDDSRGEVIAALRRGGRYSNAEMAALASENAAYLKRIVCELAMLHLLRRRPTFSPELLEAYEKIRAGHLKDLQAGNSLLFGDEATAKAGRASVHGPTVIEWQSQNLIRDSIRNYFPGRRDLNTRSS